MAENDGIIDVIDISSDDDGWVKEVNDPAEEQSSNLIITSVVVPSPLRRCSPRHQSASTSQPRPGPSSTRNEDSNPIVALIRPENSKTEKSSTNRAKSSICDDVIGIPIPLRWTDRTRDGMVSYQVLKSSTQLLSSSKTMVPVLKRLRIMNILPDKDSTPEQSNSTANVGTRKRTSFLSANSSNLSLASPKIAKVGSEEEMSPFKISDPCSLGGSTVTTVTTENDPSESQSNQTEKTNASDENDIPPSQDLHQSTRSQFPSFSTRPKPPYTFPQLNSQPIQVEEVTPSTTSTTATDNQNVESPGALENAKLMDMVRVVKEGLNKFSRLPGHSPYSRGAWHPIHFKGNQRSDESHKEFYRIAQINVQLDISALSTNYGGHKLSGHLTQWSLIQAFPGLVHFQIQVEQKQVKRSNNIRLVTERELSEKEADDMKIRDMVVQPNEFPGKKLKFVLVQYFSYEFETLKVPPELIALSGQGRTNFERIFELEFEKFNGTAKMFVMNVNFSSTGIVGDPSYDERSVELHPTKTIRILNHFFKRNRTTSRALSIPHPVLRKSDSEGFFYLAKDFQIFEDNADLSIQHPSLIPRLLKYQQKAVKWMLQREKNTEDNSFDLDLLKKIIYRRMYIQIKLNEGSIGERTAYYSTTSGQISRKKQRVEEFQIPRLPSGGILADEMGLGKTFETLSLILENRRSLLDDNGEISSGQESERSNGPQIEPSTSKQQGPKKTVIIKCRCGRVTADHTNDKNGKIVTCIECTAVHHAQCFGYDPEFLSEQVLKKYMCPTCVSNKEPVPSKSTLIVVPSSILQQWIDEIGSNVAEDLHYVIYSGVSRTCYQPAVVLSQQDIVLTTYEILRAEIPYTQLPPQPKDKEPKGRLRKSKRYVPLPSPLISVGWWRICLDEAQMVETVHSSMSRLAQRLRAEHRWCITGTPIMNTLQDLFGLCTFLGVEMISSKISWETLVMEPWRKNDTEIIKNLFGHFFFRTEKEDVEDELRIPSQTEVIHKLEFSPVEKVLHSAKYRHWSQKLRKELESYPPDLDDVDLCELNKVTRTWVEKLRRIACPPQIEDCNVETFKLEEHDEKGKAMFGTLTVTHLLQRLIKEGRSVYVKNYKPLATSLNVIGGLSVLLGQRAEAVSKYKEILSLERKHNVDSNKTQGIKEIHSMANLLDLIGEDDDEKETRKAAQDFLNKTKEILLGKYSNSLSSANKDLTSLNKNILDGTKIFESEEGRGNKNISHGYEMRTTDSSNRWWWVGIVKAISEGGSFNKLIRQIKDSISMDAKEFKLELNSGYNEDGTFDSGLTLSKKLEEHVLEMKDSYKELLDVWMRVNAEDPYKTHRFVSTCKFHNKRRTTPRVVRPDPRSPQNPRELCVFCDHFLKFESLVFRTSQIQLGQKGQHCEADRLKPWGHLLTWDPHGFGDKSITENILNEILNFVKKLKISTMDEEIAQGVAHMKLFKDFKELCWLMSDWRNKKEAQMYGLDLILQATVPLANVNKLNDFQTKLLELEHVQEFVEGRARTLTPEFIRGRIEDQISKLSTIVQMDFDKSVTHLEYLRMLEKNECGRLGYVNPDLCSCSKVLGQKWGFLPCGHSICEVCGDIEEVEGSVCPIPECQQHFQHSDLLFVDTKTPRQTATKNEITWPISCTKIMGEPFTKVEAIIRTLKSLKDNPDHQNDKVLVVSAWKPMLEILGIGLRQNGISFNNYSYTHLSYRKYLIQFRTNEKQVMLMPLAIASTGLNLTEANHIFLLEPILNLSREQQAIGRIHRLGQRKETFIHRFYVAGTVEEIFYQRSKNTEAVEFEEENMSVADLHELLQVRC